MTREEAIHIVKTTKDWSELREALAVLVPELSESEDERIRKKLIGIFTNQSLCDVYNLKSEDVLAYLERQKEQKHYCPSWKPSEEQMEALENSTALTEEQGMALYSLIQDLKKLYYDRREN